MIPRVVLAFITVIFILFSINSISAICDSGQIDINTATVEELQNIIQIGSVRAEQMITLRPFSSVDDMIRIVGIGNAHLNSIKEEGLACVGEEAEEEIVEESAEETTKEEFVEEYQETAETLKRETTPLELETINLNPKVIKSEDDMENPNKNNYAIYGFVFFSILLGVLFFLRKNKYKENEFG